MFYAILVVAVIGAALGRGSASGHRGGLISRTPYNNQHSDAAGARDRALL